MRVAVHEANRGGIDQIEIAVDQFAKCRLGAHLHVIGEQLSGVGHFQLTIKDPLTGKTEQIKLNQGKVISETGTDLHAARAAACAAVERIQFEGAHSRRDLAAKALKELCGELLDRLDLSLQPIG